MFSTPAMIRFRQRHRAAARGSAEAVSDETMLQRLIFLIRQPDNVEWLWKPLALQLSEFQLSELKLPLTLKLSLKRPANTTSKPPRTRKLSRY